MAIVLFDGRPAIQVVNGTYETSEGRWAHLGDPEVRRRLEKAVAAVGRVEDDVSRLPFLGTAFAVGPGLMVGAGAPEGYGQLFVMFDGGDRVPVTERIPLAFGNVGYELLRVRLPDGIDPLALSALAPDELVDRDVAVIGYPASDSRNDPAAMQRIFGGVLDTKRLLPGRVTGRAEDGGLEHDSSTLGGCGGAPLVDIVTGEVLGIHYGGMYLKTNLAVPAITVAPQVAAAQSGRRSSSRRSVRSAGTAVRDRATDATADVELPVARPAAVPVDQPAPEVVPLPSDRPAVSTRDWQQALPGDWQDVFKPHQLRVQTAVKAVGRVLDEAAVTGWIGTAFLVGERLALTASFVALTFAEGSAHTVRIQPGHRPAVDFSDALGTDSGTATAAVTGVRFIHPYFQVALLELEQTPKGVTQLELASRLPANLSNRPVVLVSYTPAKTLVLQPGQALQVGELPDQSRLPALAHDCASDAGAAGGPVVDLGTGYVIGLHSHGRTGQGLNSGFAQPPWELARDPELWDGSLPFRPDPKPPWLELWGAGAVPEDVGKLPPTPQHWTVDRVPIDWALKEPKDLQNLLVASMDADIALFQAENVGLRPGQVDRGGPPELLWRKLLKTLAIAGLLRGFLENIAKNPDYGGIAPQLRLYL